MKQVESKTLQEIIDLEKKNQHPKFDPTFPGSPKRIYFDKTWRGAKIYVLVGPVTNDVRYVGKTLVRMRTRILEHYFDSHNRGVSAWMRELRALGMFPRVYMVTHVAGTAKVVGDVERQWIRYYASLGRIFNAKGNDGSLEWSVAPPLCEPPVACPVNMPPPKAVDRIRTGKSPTAATERAVANSMTLGFHKSRGQRQALHNLQLRELVGHNGGDLHGGVTPQAEVARRRAKQRSDRKRAKRAAKNPKKKRGFFPDAARHFEQAVGAALRSR